MIENETAASTDGLIDNRGINAGKMFRGYQILPEDFQMLGVDHPLFQASRTVEVIPDESGVFMVLEDHMKQRSHRAFTSSHRIRGN